MIEVFNETNEIHLSGIVGDGWAEDPITKDGVLKALKAFGSQAVTIRINSPGGAADEGISIRNLLKDYAGEVTTVNDSLAASAASVIFLGGSKRLMGDGSRVMIHRAMGMAFGNATEIKKTLAALESYDQSLVEIYANFLGKDPVEILALMDAETWYNVDEAIASGLATGRVENSKKHKKPKNAFDSAAALLRRAKMAEFVRTNL
jgi:ATP-dependent Clp protease protease subunit